MRKKIRGLVPLIVFGILLLTVSLPYRFARRCWSACFHKTDAERRRSETIWQYETARFFHRVIFPMMGIRMPITIHGEIPLGQPCILVSNHRTAIDHLILAMVMGTLHLDYVLWVLKYEMQKAWFLGSSFVRAGYAFVTRRGNPRDKDRIREMARMARQDGVSVALYAEGTRFNGTPSEGVRFKHLLEPKIGGFQIFLEELPGYPVVFVCMDWRGLTGTTILDGEGFLDIHGNVHVWQRDLVPGDDARSVLDEGWARMEELLS